MSSRLFIAATGVSMGFFNLAAICAAGVQITPGQTPDSPDGTSPVAVFQVDFRAGPLTPTSGARRDTLGGLITGNPDLLINGVDPESDTPMEVAFRPDGFAFVVASRDSRNLIMYEAANRTVLFNTVLSGSPNAVAVSSDGQYAVTANIWEDTASIVSLASGVEQAVVPVGNQPMIVRITPDGTTAIVGNAVDANLSVIDIATGVELRRIAGATFVGSVSVNFEPGAIVATCSEFEVPNNDTVIMPDFFNDRIQFFDIDTGAVTSVACSDQPRGIAVTPDGAKAVISHTSTSARLISVVDIASKTITKTINIGVDVWGPVAVNAGGTKAVVAIQNAARVVNLVTNAVSPNLNTLSVNDLVNTFDGEYALVVGFSGALISYTSESIVKQLNNIVSTSIGAASPVEHRAIEIAQTFGEDMLVLNTNGASGFVEEHALSGPAPEGDKTRMVAISADGTRAVATGIFSDSAGVFDLVNQALLGIVPVGDRPAGVEITPDGSRAVVANLDSTFTTIIDLNTLLPTNVAISRRAGELEISPDGSVAYLAVIADGDGVWRVNPNTMSVIGTKLPTGDMGAVGFMYQQVSGVTLSHDGGTLVTCNSFHNTQAGQPDSISIIDTASWTEVKRLVVGQFCTRALFSADDSKIYVSNRDDDTVSVVENLGASSFVSGTINVGDQPFEMALSPDESRLYVMNFNSKTISFVSLPGGNTTNTIPLPNFPAGMKLRAGDGRLLVATGNWSVSIGPGPLTVISQDGELVVIDTATATIEETIEIGRPPAMLAYNEASGRAAAPSPFIDGLALFNFGGAPCPGDFDQDGDVDQSDLGVLLADFGCTAGVGNCPGDIDGDGDTDQSDLGILLAAFGLPCP